MSSAIEVLKKFRYTDENVSINQLHNALDVALLALEQKEKLKQEITYQLDQIIYTDKIKEDIRRSVWKEVLELMK